jgi:chemotaxis signal transduction protein
MNTPNEIAIDVELIHAEPSERFLKPLLQHQYILTEVGKQQLVFPSQWVAEIILIKRSQILSLPYYSSILLGVTHHQGSMVPLISSSMFLSEFLSEFLLEFSNQPHRSAFLETLVSETLYAVRLNQLTGKLAGVGIVVDRVIGNISEAQVSASGVARQQFQFQDIPDYVWCPQ